MATGKIVVFVLAVILQTCHCGVQVNGQTKHLRILGSLNRYYLYHPSLDEGKYIDFTVATVASLPIVKTEDVAIVIHGREDAAFSEFGKTMRESLMVNNNNMAVILIDWSIIANRDYDYACNSAPSVADNIATMITTLAVDKIDLMNTHIIGFDIGAHIAGMVSRKSRVRKITGLSPAGQNWGEYSLRLSEEDADLVEVIHTDYTGARAFGINDPIGLLNLYANTGTSQPGCSTNQCNHDRAWQLFQASLDMGGHLVGLGCDGMTEMTRNQCTNPLAVVLGTNALEKPGTGIYRVNTGRAYPYNV